MPATSPTQAQASGDDAVIDGRPVTLSEVKALLEREREARSDEDFTYEQRLAYDHATHFSRLPLEQARELHGKLRENPKVTEAHAVKIIDLAPSHADDVRAIFAKDRVQLEKEEIDRIIELVRGYLG